MSLLIRKMSRLERWRREVDRELAAVEKSIRLLSRRLRGLGKNYRSSPYLPPSAPSPQPSDARPPRVAESRTAYGTLAKPAVQREFAEVRAWAEKADRERFVDYMSSNFQPERPLRHERHIQRNKAIMMLILLALLVMWIVARQLM